MSDVFISSSLEYKSTKSSFAGHLSQLSSNFGTFDVTPPTCQDYTIPFAYLEYEKQHHNVIPGRSGSSSIVSCRTDGVGKH